MELKKIPSMLLLFFHPGFIVFDGRQPCHCFTTTPWIWVSPESNLYAGTTAIIKKVWDHSQLQPQCRNGLMTVEKKKKKIKQKEKESVPQPHQHQTFTHPF
jgi:hypothetical protein